MPLPAVAREQDKVFESLMVQAADNLLLYSNEGVVAERQATRKVDEPLGFAEWKGVADDLVASLRQAGDDAPGCFNPDVPIGAKRQVGAVLLDRAGSDNRDVGPGQRVGNFCIGHLLQQLGAEVDGGNGDCRHVRLTF